MIFFDLETGGLDKDRHPIIQFAFIDYDSCEELEIKVMFPINACDKKALEINRYNRDVWEKEAVHPDIAAVEVAKFLSKHATIKKESKSGKIYKVASLCGHNSASFDGQFIRSWFKRRGQFLPADHFVMDTLHFARWMSLKGSIKKMDSYSLNNLHYQLTGNYIDGAHDALVDVRATITIYEKMMGI